jgi:hypothetical protein
MGSMPVNIFLSVFWIWDEANRFTLFRWTPAVSQAAPGSNWERELWLKKHARFVMLQVTIATVRWPWSSEEKEDVVQVSPPSPIPTEVVPWLSLQELYQRSEKGNTRLKYFFRRFAFLSNKFTPSLEWSDFSNSLMLIPRWKHSVPFETQAELLHTKPFKHKTTKRMETMNEFQQPYLVIAAYALLQIGTVIISAVSSLVERLSQTYKSCVPKFRNPSVCCLFVTSFTGYALLNASRTAADDFDAK